MFSFVLSSCWPSEWLKQGRGSEAGQGCSAVVGQCAVQGMFGVSSPVLPVSLQHLVWFGICSFPLESKPACRWACVCAGNRPEEGLVPVCWQERAGAELLCSCRAVAGVLGRISVGNLLWCWTAVPCPARSVGLSFPVPAVCLEQGRAEEPPARWLWGSAFGPHRAGSVCPAAEPGSAAGAGGAGRPSCSSRGAGSVAVLGALLLLSHLYPAQGSCTSHSPCSGTGESSRRCLRLQEPDPFGGCSTGTCGSSPPHQPHGAAGAPSRGFSQALSFPFLCQNKGQGCQRRREKKRY